MTRVTRTIDQCKPVMWLVSWMPQNKNIALHALTIPLGWSRMPGAPAKNGYF